jgi:hypothetical protein
MGLTRMEQPVAVARIDWLPPSDGGRNAGPPTTPVFATNSVFKLGGEEEVQPGSPWNAELMLTILIEEIERPRPDHTVAKIGFIAPELAEPYVRTGNRILVMNGPRVIARATITDVLECEGSPDY